jgi:hypothetical protein
MSIKIQYIKVTKDKTYLEMLKKIYQMLKIDQDIFKVLPKQEIKKFKLKNK